MQTSTGNSEKIVFLGSRHVNQSPDFANYQDKMLTANNRMIKFSGKRCKPDWKPQRIRWQGGSQAKIVFNEETGIEITGTADIVLETIGEGSITLQAMEGSFGGMDGIKSRFTEAYTKGENT